MPSGYALLAFFGLTAIHVSAAILYKYSQSEGKYEYSPATTLVLAEVFKIFLSLFLHSASMWRTSGRASFFAKLGSAIMDAWRDVRLHVNWRNVGQFSGLALSYAIYNQCQFLVFLWADAASVVLIRSSGSFVAALMAFFLLKRLISRQQWTNIVLQVFGLVLVQYDACHSRTNLSSVMYVLLFVHVSLSSFNSIWNEHLVKSTTAPPLNVQNAILYTFGALFNFAAYLILPDSLYGITTTATNGTTAATGGFFHGYTFLTLLIVLLNSFIGITITAVYKYADVIVKTFSLACATGTLFLVDYFFFNRSIGINVLLGILVVYVASYLYFTSASPATAAANALPPPSTRVAATSFACLCIPDFFIQKTPSKTTLSTFFITYLVLIAYIAINASDFKPVQKSPPLPLSFRVPVVATPVPAEKTMELFTKNNTEVVRSWLVGPHNVKLRNGNFANRLDQMTQVWRQRRAHLHGSAHQLATCFLDANLVHNAHMMRWNAELDFSAVSSFDKFVVHDTRSNFQYAALVDPIASIKTETSTYKDLRETKTDSSYCSMEDWIRTVEAMNDCIDLIEYHKERYELTYDWLWITETVVTWQPNSATPRLSTLDASKIYVRSEPLSQNSETVDPSSLLGSYETVKSFVRQLQAQTFSTCTNLHRKIEETKSEKEEKEEKHQEDKEESLKTKGKSPNYPARKDTSYSKPKLDDVDTVQKKAAATRKSNLATASFSCTEFSSPPQSVFDIIQNSARETHVRLTTASFMPLRGDGKACVSSLQERLAEQN